jgi:hypothetical protein
MKAIRKLSLLAALACLLWLTGSVRAADDEVPTFKKRGDQEKAFVTKVGASIIKAARFKPQKIELDKYEITDPKKDRKDLKIKMIYHGLVTKKKYTADITVKVDSGDKDKWEVLRIDYEDNNPSLTKPNRTKIDDLVKKFNR